VLTPDLPDIDGPSVLTRLRRDRRTREIPVLFACATIDERDEALRLGASDVLSLPLRSEETLARVRTQLELSQLRAAARNRDAGDSRAAMNGSWINLAMQTGKMYTFEWDAVTDEVYRSRSCTQVLAADTRDTGQNWFRRVHPDDVDHLRRVLSILSPAYDAYDTKYRVQRSDGQWVTIHESSRGFFDSANQLVRVTGVVLDVTEQAVAERDLAGFQTEILKLLDKLPIPVALANEFGWIEYINHSFQRTFGYRLEQIAKPADWWRLAYPDEQYRREVIAAWETSTGDNRQEGRDIPQREYLIAGADGALHTVVVFGAVLRNRKLIVFDDITERKRAEVELRESEERFRLMADTAPMMLWMSGADKLCTFFNKGWLDYTGRALEQELGDGWAQNVHPDDLGRCIRTYNEAFDARRKFKMEYRLRRANGEYGWILDIGMPRFEKTGAFAGYVGSCLDITEIKEQHEHMLAAQRLESLGVIASGISHDFNNLLGCILLEAAAAESELDPESPVRDGLQRIEAISARASEIVRQIMAYAGGEQLEIELVDISHVVRDMLRLLEVCMPKAVDLELSFPDDLPRVSGNAAQLRQVVMNLVLNAAEAFGDRSGTIRIVARRDTLASAGGEYVCLEISDNGPGMTDAVRNRIFDPFFTTKIEGRGLGLAAVQRIVRSHRGAINVASTPGVGTRFEVLLPAGGVELSARPAGPGLPEAVETPSVSILIVEDEEALRLSVSKMLRRRGFSVLEAADGDSAIHLIRARGADLAVVLLDLTLPGKSSLEVLQELQRMRPDVKVILTSAYGRDGVSGGIRTLRHDSFIRKPYQVRDLVSVLRSTLSPAEIESVGPS
jgi:PAS domain S-box-containing protein